MYGKEKEEKKEREKEKGKREREKEWEGEYGQLNGQKWEELDTKYENIANKVRHQMLCLSLKHTKSKPRINIYKKTFVFFLKMLSEILKRTDVVIKLNIFLKRNQKSYILKFFFGIL